jgi:hypothetical protein
MAEARGFTATFGNPKTGEIVKIKPKKLPFFKCGKELKERVDNQKPLNKKMRLKKAEK